jgi:hypothetical protein
MNCQGEKNRTFLCEIFACCWIGLCLPLFASQQTQGEVIIFKQLPDVANHRVLKTFTVGNSPFDLFTTPCVTFQDKDGYYWIGSVSGDRVYRYDSRTQAWTIFVDESSTNPIGLHYETAAILPLSIGRINQSKDGNLWFSSTESIRLLKGRDADLSSYNGKKWKKHEITIGREHPWQLGIFRGTGGTLWFWNNDELRSYDGQKFSNPILLSERLRNLKNSIVLKSGRFESIGTHTDQQNENYAILEALQDREGYIWLCTRNGIVKFDERKNKFIKFLQNELGVVSKIYEDQTGRIWFSDGFDVAVYDKRKNTSILYTISNHLSNPRSVSVTSIYQDKRRQIFIGLDKGLLVYKELENKWEYFNLKEIDSNQIGNEIRIEQIMEDKLGKIWVTTSSGIIILDK